MRQILWILGVVLIVGGIAANMGKLSYTKHDEVAKIGGLSAEVDHDQGFPKWASLGAIVAGGLMLVGGALTAKRN